MADSNAYSGYVGPEYLRMAADLCRLDKERTYTAMDARPGAHILDVGCGAGVDTIPLARLVGENGMVTGVDLDPRMVTEAERHAAESGVSGWTRHLVADASALPFTDNAFDAVRCERVFQHLADPAAALSELIRVTRPQGCVVVYDTDYSAMSIDSDETDIERRLARFTAARLRNGYIARSLRRRFIRAGLAEVTVELLPQQFTHYQMARLGWLNVVEPQALAAGILTEDELARWHADLERQAGEDAFFASLAHVLVSGKKV